MPPRLATVACLLVIAGLFALDRDRTARTSAALWLPVAYLLISGSRAVTDWLAIAGLGTAVTATSPEHYLEGSPIDRLVMTGFLAAGLLVLAARGRRVTSLLAANVPIVIFLAYGLVSTVWSDFPAVAFKRWIKALGDVVMIAIVLTDGDRPAALRRLLSRTGLVLVPLSVLFVKYYPDLGRSYDPWEGTAHYVGVAGDKNMLGMICLIAGLGAIWRLIGALGGDVRPATRGMKVAQAALLAMVVYLLSLADSMTSLSCFLMAASVMTATRLFRAARRPAVVYLMAGAVLTVAFSALFLDSGGGLLESMGRNPTLTGRTGLWAQLIGMNPHVLVGAGFESFWLGARLETLWSLYSWHPNEAHNGYLEVFLNLGWVGVSLLGVLIVAGYRNAMSMFRSDLHQGRLRIAYVLAATAYSFTEAGFRMTSPVWILFLTSTAALPATPAAPIPVRKGALRLAPRVPVPAR